jgi:hypothetical protein
MLTPVTVDPSHPFPHVLNKALCIGLLLRRRRHAHANPVFGVLTLPRAVPRLLRLPSGNGGNHFVFLRDIVAENAAQLYRGYEILASAPFRITRNSNLYLEEEEARTLLEAVDLQVAQRRKGNAVRLEIESGAHPQIVSRLVSTFELDESLVFHVDGPVNLQRLFNLCDDTPRPEQGRLAAAKAFRTAGGIGPRRIPLRNLYDSSNILHREERGAIDPGRRALRSRRGLLQRNRARTNHGAHGRAPETAVPARTLDLLGVHIFGEDAAELLHIGQAILLLKGKITYFIQTVFNYPTLAECYKAAAFNGLNRLG